MLKDFISKYSQRIQTGIYLLIGILSLSLIDSFFLWWLMFGVIMFGALYEALELYQLASIKESKSNRYQLDETNVYIMAGVLWLCALFVSDAHYLVYIAIVAIGSFVAYDKDFDSNILKPLLYPIAPILFLLALYDVYGIQYLIWLIAIVSFCDIFAFVGGKFFGKTSFCETSPNKTLEGVFSGILASMLVSVVISPSDVGFVASIFISFFVAIASVFGDLYESMLKRKAGVKDSGSLLPGHGGVLDRLDGYLFAVVAFFALISF